MHYTQQPSRVTSQTNSAATVLYARLQGFIDAAILRGELRRWDELYGESLPSALLLDLRDVAGYGQGTPSIARTWLSAARGRGVARISFVAGSSVVRTLVSMISPHVNVQMRCFLSDEAAIDWLEGRPVTTQASKQRRRAPAGPPQTSP